jgi:hypothetical protein
MIACSGGATKIVFGEGGSCGFIAFTRLAVFPENMRHRLERYFDFAGLKTT